TTVFSFRLHISRNSLILYSLPTRRSSDLLLMAPEIVLLALGGRVQLILHLLHPEHPALVQVLAQKQVEQEAEDGHKVQGQGPGPDRKSTRLNSSHVSISYAVFCLKNKIKI